jgi:hypothetical protein
MGISRQAVMKATGHRPGTVHEKYTELSETQLLEAFRPIMSAVSSKKHAARAKAV